jgi:phosphoribosyl 1,2-cyclic phosphate phosphodiesterase
MEIVILGSGTSHGVPMIGCDCEVCRSDNPKNRRFRPSILVRNQEHAVLVDTTPELRMQALAANVCRVDAVLITHTHADHIMGLDDLRRFNDLADAEIPVYGDYGILEDIRRIYPYIFKETQAGGGKPRLTLHCLESEFTLFGLQIEPFYVLHGRLPVLSYRFEVPATAEGPAVRVAYVTDVSEIPAGVMEKLSDLDLLILDAVRFDPHPTHFGLYQALDVIAEVKPHRALLTHLSHQYDHDLVNAQLHSHVQLAYDGQTLCF